jgi:purine-cytosine permease-like protein
MPEVPANHRSPSWRKSFLRAFYLSLIAIFMFLLFDLRGDLFLGYLGTLLAAVGAIRIADWFVWKRLEPGSSPETDIPSLFS